MKITVEKDIILNAMKKCLYGIEKGKSKIDGADSFTFKDGTIAAYNDAVAVSAIIPYENLSGTIKADLAYKLFQKLEDSIDITNTGAQWIIQSGKTNVALNLFHSDALVYIDSLNIDEEDFSPVPKEFFTAIKICSMPKNKTDRDGIYVEGEFATSTDLFRMTFFKMSTPMSKFWISEESAKVVSSVEGITHYRVNHSWVHFKLFGGTTFSVRKKADMLYPFSQMMNIYKKYSTHASVTCQFPASMKDTLNRVAVLADSDLHRPIVELKFSKEGLGIAGRCQAGSIEDMIEWETEFPYSSDFNVKMDSLFLNEALSKSSTFYILESAEKDAIVVGGEEFLNITLAMRG